MRTVERYQNRKGREWLWEVVSNCMWYCGVMKKCLRVQQENECVTLLTSILEPRKTKRDSLRGWNMSGNSFHGQGIRVQIITRLWVLCSMVWKTGFLNRPLTQLQMCILSLSFETVVWIISSRCVLELAYGKSSTLIFYFRHLHRGSFPWWQQRLVHQWTTLLHGSSDRAFIFL